MSVLCIDNITLSLGPFPLLDKICLQIESKDKLCLIGRNGEGKSTLLKIIAGIDAADTGSIKKEPHIEVAFLSQDLPPADNKTVFEVVSRGLSDLGALLQEYHRLTLQSETHYADPNWLKQMELTQHRIDEKDGWQFQQRIEKIITELKLPEDTLMSSLSGGWRRRVGIAQVLVRQPDLLLLDEPTNHLDIETIQWLEKLLIHYPKALLFITHDRALLRKTATGILELDRGKLTLYPANYDTYLSRKAKLLEEEEIHNALFDKKLAQEEAWIRQGIKARRTRNEGRVRALEKLRRIRSERREQRTGPSFSIHESKSIGKMAFEIDNISYHYTADKPIIKPFSFTIQKGDKIALIGPNGIGKSTLVQLLIGAMEPKEGQIKSSPTNQIAFFDQNRAQIDLNKTVIANVAEGDDFIDIQGNQNKRKHVISYLSDFLFTPDKCQALAKTLSGGECNRLMLAKLFAKPANVLILDEPTNDLDIESLEILESLLLEYTGTVIIISHDREFIDNIATNCIAFEGNGVLKNYVGGYSDWEAYQATQSKSNPASVKSSKKNATLSALNLNTDINPKINTEINTEININKQTNITPNKNISKKRLSYNEQREYNEIPDKITALEAKIAQLEQTLSSPEFYNQPSLTIKTTTDALNSAKQALTQLYSRWEELDP